jgi:hypothetical protein
MGFNPAPLIRAGYPYEKILLFKCISCPVNDRRILIIPGIREVNWGIGPSIDLFPKNRIAHHG